MALRARLQVLVRPSRLCHIARRSYSDFDQSSSGAIRQAGGAFSKKEQAVEDQYFKRLQQEQLDHLREEAAKHHEDEITHHEEAIHDLEAQIKRHRKMMDRHKTKLDKHVSELEQNKK